MGEMLVGNGVILDVIALARHLSNRARSRFSSIVLHGLYWTAIRDQVDIHTEGAYYLQTSLRVHFLRL
jgi:hypothetical protein